MLCHIDNNFESCCAEVKLSEGQRQAIKVAMTSPILILTGGPGCGKTYATATIVKLWGAMHKNMKLAAPTGPQNTFVSCLSAKMTLPSKSRALAETICNLPLQLRAARR